MPSMTNTATAGGSRLKGDCVDFGRFPHWMDLGREFVLGWFKFIALGNDAVLPRVYNHSDTDPDKYGWTFDPYGIRVEPTRTTSEIVIKGSSYISNPLELVAKDSADNELDREIIPGNDGLHTRTLEGGEITAVFISNDGYEGLLSVICMPSMDIEEIFDEYLKSERAKNEKIEDFLDDPNAKAILDQVINDIRAFYDGSKTLADSDGGENGESSGFSFNWPPDWDCVLVNAILLAAVTVALTGLAAILGVPTIGALAKADAIAFLTKTFGFATATAESIFTGLLAIGAAGLAVKNCI